MPVITGVDLVTAIGIVPDATAVVRGTSIDTAIGDVDLHQTADGVFSDLPADPDRPGELGAVTTWHGVIDADLTAVIEPEVRVETLLGTFTLASFPIPVTLVDSTTERSSEPVFVAHPLPVLDGTLLGLDATGHDFGTVEVGTRATWDVAVDDLGALLLTADVRIEDAIDPSAFAVWPGSVAALPGTGTGFTVSFAPTAAGTQHATLTVDTNDPTMPSISIPLTAIAVDADPSGSDPAADGGTPLSTCGCAVVAPSPPALLPLLGLAAFSARRRRPDGASRTSTPPPRR